MKTHMRLAREGAFSGFFTGSLCGRLSNASKDGMNITDKPAEVTCAFCLKHPRFTKRSGEAMTDQNKATPSVSIAQPLKPCGKRCGFGRGIRGLGTCKLLEGHGGDCNPRKTPEPETVWQCTGCKARGASGSIVHRSDCHPDFRGYIYVTNQEGASGDRPSDPSPALVRCWRCKHDVPEATTVCNAGIGTQCKDSKACRGRWYGPHEQRTNEAKARGQVSSAGIGYHDGRRWRWGDAPPAGPARDALRAEIDGLLLPDDDKDRLRALLDRSLQQARDAARDEAADPHIFASPDSLECSHCGGPAIGSPDGTFRDGDGERCMTCGHPGHVSCDSETPAEWVIGELATDYCAIHDCDECNERRRDLIVDRTESDSCSDKASPPLGYDVEMIEHGDEGRQELRITRGGKVILSELDRGEPEDNSYYRDWRWVPVELRAAYAHGLADGRGCVDYPTRGQVARLGLAQAALTHLRELLASDGRAKTINSLNAIGRALDGAQCSDSPTPAPIECGQGACAAGACDVHRSETASPVKP